MARHPVRNSGRTGKRLDWVPASVWVCAGLVTLVVYARLPGLLPVHWSGSGEPDLWLSKPLAVCLGLLLPPTVYGLLTLKPELAGGQEGWAHTGVRRSLSLTFLILYGALLASGLGLSGRRLLLVTMGLVLLALASTLSVLPPNPFFGTRTVYTRHPTVWTKTHRLTAFLAAAIGFAMLLGAVLAGDQAFWLLPIGVLTVAVGSYLSAWVLVPEFDSPPLKV